MNIAFKKGFSEETTLSIVALSIILHEVFGNYKQEPLTEAQAEAQPSSIVVPVLEFDPKPLLVKNKELPCFARYIVYSQHQDSDKPCERFIHDDVCTDRIKWIGAIPKNILHAYTDGQDEVTIQDLFNSLVDPKAAKTRYFYKESDEESTTHSVAIINEYGDKKNPHCITTAYLSIKGK